MKMKTKMKRKLSLREQKINFFYKFLLDNDVFIEWREGVRKCRWTNMRLIFKEPEIWWIAKSFIWYEATDGIEWWDVAVKWQDAYEKKYGKSEIR